MSMLMMLVHEPLEPAKIPGSRSPSDAQSICYLHSFAAVVRTTSVFCTQPSLLKKHTFSAGFMPDGQERLMTS